MIRVFIFAFFFSIIFVDSHAQSLQKINLMIVEDDTPNPEVPMLFHKKLEDRVSSFFISNNQFYNVLNRNLLKFIELERTLQEKTQMSNLEQGIDIGGDYAVVNKIISAELTFKNKTKIKERGKPPVKVPDVGICDGKIKILTKIISIETGEIIFDYSRVYVESSEGKLHSGLDGNHFKLEQKTFDKIINFYLSHLQDKLIQLFDQNYKIIKIIDPNKKDHILITGGKKGGMPTAAHFNVSEIVQEEIDGKIVLRNKVIGQLQVVRVNQETTICKIRKNKEAVLASVLAKKSLICNVIKTKADLRE